MAKHTYPPELVQSMVDLVSEQLLTEINFWLLYGKDDIREWHDGDGGKWEGEVVVKAGKYVHRKTKAALAQLRQDVGVNDEL